MDILKSLARTCLALPLAVATVLAQPQPLWELDSQNNRVLLMGSIHFLRATDYPLHESLEAAYNTADTLVMELNLSGLDQAAAQASIVKLGMDPQGRTLRDLIGSESYDKASLLAADIGVPLVLFDQFEPWFAALSITQLRMQQLGFEPGWGVEAQLTRKAEKDGKVVVGLESFEEQLGFMDGLDLQTQSAFLLQSLDDAASVQNEVEAIVAAWRQGDSEALEQLLLQGVQAAPNLYDAILVQRNRNWVQPIQALLDTRENHLVVVGALHLVGEDSIIALLHEAGVNSRQLTDADMRAIANEHQQP